MGLRRHYAKEGMVVNAMITHYGVDPLDFNAKCNDAIDLETRVHPDPELRSVLQHLDPAKVKLWLFSNAYINQARRIVRRLGVEDLFEGITFCDYTERPVIGKPDAKVFYKAMREAGAHAASECYLVDDSRKNCAKAERLGWTAVHYIEPHLRKTSPVESSCQFGVDNLRDLLRIFPEFCKTKSLM